MRRQMRWCPLISRPPKNMMKIKPPSSTRDLAGMFGVEPENVTDSRQSHNRQKVGFRFFRNRSHAPRLHTNKVVAPSNGHSQFYITVYSDRFAPF